MYWRFLRLQPEDIQELNEIFEEIFDERWYGKEFNSRDLDKLLVWGAKYGCIEMCELAKKWGAVGFNEMLFNAKNKEMAKLAKKWGASNFNGMICAAASHGNIELCELAKKWGANDFAGMYENASEPLPFWDYERSTEKEIENLAIEWGLEDFNRYIHEQRKISMFLSVLAQNK